MTHPSTDPLVGRTIAQYEILARVGGGGMGVVYKARDTKLGRVVALKFLPQQWSHDETSKQRFLREAQAASATNHPNICTIHDIENADDGQLFIVMAYYEGQTLKQLLERGALPIEEALDIATQMADGLAKAHAQGIVHRDVKPGNVILTEDGVRLLDFGLATFADALKLTTENSTLGTAAYMSPEQVQGRNADARSDVWAVGVVLYEMLVGHVPFRGTHSEAIGYAIRNEAPTPLRSERPEVPEDVEQLVFRALHKEPNVRQGSGRELARALRQVRRLSLPLDLRTEPVIARIGLDPTPSFFARHRRKLVTAVAAAAAVVLAVGTWRAYLSLIPVERIPIAIAPVVNQTRYPELDPYRLALTQVFVTELAESPNVRVLPYARLLQILRRFIATGTDVSSREAFQAITVHGAPRFVALPTLIYENGRWSARVEIQDASTATRVAVVGTESVASALVSETALRLIGELASGLQAHFKTNGPGKSYALRAVSARPRSLEAAKLFEEGLNAFEELEYSAAEQSLAQALEKDSRNPIPIAWLSRVEQILRKTDQASAAAETAARLLTGNTPRLEALFVNAVVAEARRDFESAEASYRQFDRLYPDEPAWLVELGGFQDRRGQTEPAIVSYQQALRLDGDLARPEVELCRLYNRANDMASAKKHGRQGLAKYIALEARGGEAQAHFCLADALRAGAPDERQEARRHADAALKIVEELGLKYNLSRAYYYVGLARAEEGNLAEGAAFWEKAANAAKSAGNRSLEPIVLMNLGVAHARLGNRQRAMEFYRLSSEAHQALGDEVRAAQVQINRAQLRIDFGDNPDQAVGDVKNALAVFLDQGDRNFEVFSRQALGSYYRYTARYEEAKEELNRARAIAGERDLKEDIASLTIDLARVHFDQNAYNTAMTLLDTIGDGLGQHSLHAWIRLARTRIRLGDFVSARIVLRKALDDVAKRKETEYLPVLYMTLGELEYESENLSEARLHFSRAAMMWKDDLPDPSSVEAKAYLGLLDALQNRPRGRAEIESSMAQAARMRQVGLDAQCRIFLGRAFLRERRYDDALRTLNGIKAGGPESVGPELLAQALYWRGQGLAAKRDTTAAADADRQARKLLDDLRATLPEQYRDGFAKRLTIRLIGG